MMAPGSSLATPSRAGGKAAKRSQFGRSAHSILKIAGSSSVPWCRRRSDPARCAWLCSGRWTTRRLPRPSSRVAPRCGPAAFPAACLYLWEPPAGSFGSSAPCPLEEKTGPPKTPETNWDGMGGRKAAHGPLPRVPSACLAEAPPLQSKGAGRAELPCELGDHSRLRRPEFGGHSHPSAAPNEAGGAGGSRGGKGQRRRIALRAFSWGSGAGESCTKDAGARQRHFATRPTRRHRAAGGGHCGGTWGSAAPLPRCPSKSTRRSPEARQAHRYTLAGGNMVAPGRRAARGDVAGTGPLPASALH